MFSRNRGNGGVYDYFICLSRKTKRRPCSRTVIRLDAIEAAIARFYGSFQLCPRQVEAIRAAVGLELEQEQQLARDDQQRATKRIAKLTDQRSKLLAAHYSGAVPVDLLKTETERLTRETVVAKSELAAARATLVDLAGRLEQALAVAGQCNKQYLLASARIRRQINQGLFKALYLARDGDIERVELTEPFAQLLADDLLSTVSAGVILAEEADEAAPWTDDRSRPSTVLHSTIPDGQAREAPQQVLPGRGLHNVRLVPPVGVEPTL